MKLILQPLTIEWMKMKLLFLSYYVKKKLLGFWILLYPFKENMEKISHNMLSLMLDTRFKTLCLVSSFIDHVQGEAIVKEYEIVFLFPMLLKCHYHMHHLAEFERVMLIKGLKRTLICR
jgi:hypothetical protein